MDKDTFITLVSNLDAEMRSLPCQNENALPIIDGIININGYFESNNRILFVLKNPYSIVEDNGGWSVVESLNKKQSLKEQDRNGKPTFQNLIAIVSTIINKNVSLDIDYLNSVEAYNLFKNNSAYINICKELTIGKTVSNNKLLKSSYRNNRDFLIKQIEIYNPKYIILGGTLKFVTEIKASRINILDAENVSLLKEYYRCKVFTSDKRIYIAVDHPSYPISFGKRIITSEEYCKNIFNAINQL